MQGNQPKRVPKTKDQLIKMLKQRLQSAETAITQMQEVLQSERDKRQNLSQELQEKQSKIAQLIQRQSKTLQDKVQQSLFNTLQSANKIRNEAEQELKILQGQNEGLNEQIELLDKRLRQTRLQMVQKNKKISILQYKKNDLKLKNINQQKKQKELKQQKQKIQKQYERINKQYNELYQIIQNLKKIKNYLNVTTIDTHNRKVDSQKQNRIIKKHTVSNNNQDNFWNVES